MMKNPLLFPLIFLQVLSLSAQAPSIAWEHSMGGSSDEYAHAVCITADGGYATAGYTASNDSDVSGNHGGKDFWVVKTNGAGAIEWQHCYGGSNDEIAYSIQQTSDAGYIIAGFSESADGQVTGHHGGADTTDFWVVKTDSSGNIQWEQSYGGTEYDGASDIVQTTDGGYMLVGYTQSADGDISVNRGGSDFWVVKLFSSGTIAWEKTYGGSSWDNAAAVQQTSDGGYIVAGNAYSSDSNVTNNHGLSDYWLIRLDSIGNLTWEKTYGGSANDGAESVEQTSDGGFIMAGTTNSTDGDVDPNFAPPELWVVKTDAAGAIQWKKTMGGQGSEGAGFARQTTDGGYIVSCGSGSLGGDVSGGHGVMDIWVSKLDSAGSITWEKCYGGPWFEGAAEVYPTADGGYIVCGQSMNIGGDVTTCEGGYDFWLVKLNAPVGITENHVDNNAEVYPNPFHELCSIAFPNPDQELFCMAVYDAKGQLVYTRNDIAGDVVVFERENYAAGLYFFQLYTGGATRYSGKFIIE